MLMRPTLAIGLIGITCAAGVGVIADLASTRHHHDRWYAIDGDTIDHNGQRIRLLYIDAPEMPGHCRPGRQCVAGDPYAARNALQRALDSGTIRCEGSERDVYGRTLAECFVTSPNGETVSINAAMLASGHAQPYHYQRRP